MAAFINSGRSCTEETGEKKGSNRPEAAAKFSQQLNC
jgi:hypothetical protein